MNSCKCLFFIVFSILSCPNNFSNACENYQDVVEHFQKIFSTTHSFDATGMELSLEQQNALAEALGNDNNLRELNLSAALKNITVDYFLFNNDLDSFDSLADALTANNTLEYLNLSENMLGKNFKHLANALAKSESLATLVLSQCGLFDKCRLLFKSLRVNNNQNIKVLNLSDNYFHLGGNRIDIIESLAEFIKQNNSLEELDLSRSSLSFHGILLILDSLQNKSSFFSINLYKTAPTLTSEETPMDAVTRSIIACRIGDRLKGIKSLSRLNLGYNDLGFYDAMMILDLLSSNPNIKYLNLENNNFNKRALEALCVGLSSNNYLAEIYLFGVFDTVDKEDIKIYAKALKSNTSIIKADYCLQKNSKKASTYLERNQLRKNWFLFFKYLPDFFINDDDSQSMIQLLPPELKQVIILKFFQL